MTPAEARPLTYRWAGRDEWMLVQDGAPDAHVVIVQPLFGELNRSRRLLRDVMRGLARRGVGSSLPDLPGAGESPRPLAHCGWGDWTGALAAAAAAAAPGRAVHVAAIRGGALLDHAVEARSRWRLAPVTGAAVLRDLVRAQAIGGSGAGRPAATRDGGELAGYRIAPELIAALESAVPSGAAAMGGLRTVRLDGDEGAADATIAGPALWRRAEPGGSGLLAEAIAANLVAWVTACAG